MDLSEKSCTQLDSATSSESTTIVQDNFVNEISLHTSEHSYFAPENHNVVALIGSISATAHGIQQAVSYNSIPQIEQQLNLQQNHGTGASDLQLLNENATNMTNNLVLQPVSNSDNAVSETQTMFDQTTISPASNTHQTTSMVQFQDMNTILQATLNPQDASLSATNLPTQTSVASSQSGSLYNSAKYFCLQTLEDVEETIRKHTEETYSHFVVAKKTKAYGSTAEVIDVSSKFRIHWQSRDLTSTEECAVQIPFDGIPFVYIGEKAFMCHLGRSKAAKNKATIIEPQEVLDPTKVKKHRSRLTKKQGCPAKIFVKQIAKFPQFRINCNTEYLRTQMSQRLRKALETCEGDIHHVIQYVGTLPDISEHKNHEIGENTPVKEPIDPIIRDKIVEFTWECGENAMPKDIKELLDNYVENVLFKGKTPPSKNRRRYYPSEKDISNYIYKCRMISKLSMNEQDQLHMLSERLQHDHPDNKISFRIENDEHSTITIDVNNMDETHQPQINQTITPEMRLCFSYQTHEQQRLLKRYSKQIILTEISRNKIKLPFPLYGVYVPTNVDFQLVYLFIVHAKNERSIKDGLANLAQWNPYWTPKFFIVDFCKYQMSAVETYFPGSVVLISEESRNTMWDDWLSNPRNTDLFIADKEDLRRKLLNIANAYTEEALNKAAQDLENSQVWKNCEHLRDWFSVDWLADAKKWVVGYRHDEYFSTLHFDVTLTDELDYLRDAHYNHLRSKKLSDFLKNLVEEAIPACYQRYVDRNIDDYRKQFAAAKNPKEFPAFLQNKPSCLTNFILKNIEETKSSNYTINQIQPGLFCTQDKKNPQVTYVISFGDLQTLPSCICLDWLKYRLPCQHMASVFLNYTSWNWDMLSTLYTSNAVFTIDFTSFNKYNEDLYLSKKDTEKQLQQQQRQQQEYLLNEEFIKVKKTVTIPQLQFPPYPESASKNLSLMKPLVDVKSTPFNTSDSIGSVNRSNLNTQSNNNNTTLASNSLIQNIQIPNKATGMNIQLPSTAPFILSDHISTHSITVQPSANPLSITSETSFDNIVINPTAVSNACIMSTSNDVLPSQDLHFVTNLATDCNSFCQELSDSLHQLDDRNVLQKVKLDLQLMLNDVKLELSKVPPKPSKRKNSGEDLTDNLVDKKPKTDEAQELPSTTDNDIVPSTSLSNIQQSVSTTLIDDNTEWIFDNELNIKLNVCDQQHILNGDQLSLRIIKTVQIILSHQFDDVSGLIDPEKLTSTPVNDTAKGEFGLDVNKKIIQIHQCEHNHWSTSAKINENISIFCCTVTSKAQIIEQVLNMIPENSLSDNILFIERMENIDDNRDCGLYAIAYAVAFAFDIEARNLIFDENGMRMHLAECLEDMCFSMFPLKST